MSSTTGTRRGVLRIRTPSFTSPIPHTSRKKNTSAFNACLWVERSTLPALTRSPSHLPASSNVPTQL